jgi:hypothetical protein
MAATSRGDGPAAARREWGRRELLAAAGGSVLAGAIPLSPARAQFRTLTPEMFGARGDGVTNDTAAFVALSRALMALGGGTIALRRTTYIVGSQERLPPGSGYAYGPSPILWFRGLKSPLTIQGNDATLRCQAGLRYGSFDPATGEPMQPRMPYLNNAARAAPYEYMIYAAECAAAIRISDLELDGNVAKLRLGGPYGDTGRQIDASGIFLRDNRGSQVIERVRSHHHGLDGVMIDGVDTPLAPGVERRLEDVHCEYNARQGCSLIGGRDWLFRKSSFNHTGQAGFASAPSAGFDIEAETKRIRNIRFEDCEFSNNSGCGLVADTGDSQGATFLRCRFIGTVNWSAWPCKPAFRFTGCTFVGTVVRVFETADPQSVTRFTDCLFTDDPKLSPTGKVYREGRADGPLVDAGETPNPYFEHCRFVAVGGAVLPWTVKATYVNCTMRQTSRSTGYPRGHFIGRNTIDSAGINLYGAAIDGELLLNGRLFHP